MSFTIGFSATDEDNPKSENTNLNFDQTSGSSPKKSVVDVYFPERNLTCTYYNEKFDLKCGDIVFVDGKLEGKQGRVVAVNRNFKIKLSDYKQIIGVADTDIKGKFYCVNSELITTDRNALPYEKIITWFKAAEQEEYIFGSDGEAFSLDDLSGMNISKQAAENGNDYYLNGDVVYTEVSDGRGRAIVMGSKPYEVEFEINSREIKSIVCSCYCSGACKHEFAVMLQLIELLDSVENKLSDRKAEKYFAAVNKALFFKYAVDGKSNGCFTLD